MTPVGVLLCKGIIGVLVPSLYIYLILVVGGSRADLHKKVLVV